MKRYFFLLVLLLLAIIPAPGQKTNNESWRNTCKTACTQKYNTCLQEAQGDGPKKEQCYRNYKGCLNWCANPPRRA
jgi:hypothetical protein